jgi:cell division protein FtsL
MAGLPRIKSEDNRVKVIKTITAKRRKKMGFVIAVLIVIALVLAIVFLFQRT